MLRVFAALPLCLWFATGVAAQPPSDQAAAAEEPNEASADAEPRLEEPANGAGTPAASAPPPAGPDTVWIDDDGALRPVVGLSYEELLRALRLLDQQEAANAAPRFTREALRVDGVVRGDRVTLTARYEIALPAGGQVGAPLGFGNAILEAEPQIDGRGADGQFVTHDPDRGGYVAWLTGEPGDRRIVELRLTLLLERDGQQTTLRTNIPRSTRSALTIAAPTGVTDGFASSGVLLDTDTRDDGGVRLRARGVVGDVLLGWRTPNPRKAAPQQTVLSVEGRVLCEVDGTSVLSRATLLVSSYGGDLGRFRVRLPKGSTWIPSPAADDGENEPRITLLAEEAGDAERPVCLVTLPQRTSEVIRVEINAEQPLGFGEEREVDLAGFEVVGAVRQYGDVAIRVADDWRLRWRELDAARRVDAATLPPELRQPGVTAAARYYGQPWRLVVQPQRLRRRVEATPRYRLEIGRDEAVLRATIDYWIPDASVSELSVDLRDWNQRVSVQVGPVGAVESKTPTQGRDNVLDIPLAKPVSGKVAVELSAVIELNPRDETLRFRLPAALAATQGASTLLVVVDPAIEFVPDATNSRRLREAPLAPADYDPSDPSGLRTFFFKGFLPDQVLVAEKRLRPGEAEVAIHSDVTLTTSTASVRQTLDYDIRYEPVTHVRLAAPTRLVTTDQLRLKLLPAAEAGAGGAVPPGPASAGIPLEYQQGDPPEADDSRTEIIVKLPRPWVGPLRLQAAYELASGLRDLSFAGSIDAGLISPLGTPQGSHTALARATDGRPLAILAGEQGWSMVGASSSDAGPAGEARGFIDGVAGSLTIGPGRKAVRRPAEVVLRRVWWQTWVTPNRTQQQAAFRFDSLASQVSVELPESVAGQPVEVYLDGSPTPSESSGGRLTVALPERGGAEHTLEVRYFQPTPVPLNSLGWRPARLLADTGWSESYWEVILPPGLLALDSPDGFSPALGWSPDDPVGSQRPAVDTAALQEWVGAVDRVRPGDAEQRYLYSAYQTMTGDQPVSIAIVSRQTAVLVCSACVLAVGLTLIYMPRLRSVPALMVLATTAFAVGALFPGPLLLVARAGLLGLLLAGVAALLAAVLGGPRSVQVAGQRSSLINIRPPTGTDTFIALPIGTVSTNAPTISVPPQENRS